MKKYLFLLFVSFFLTSYSLSAQCDCSLYVDIENLNIEGFNTLKNHKARWKKDIKKIIYYTLSLEKNKKYTFRIYNKKGKLIDNVKVVFMNTKREVLLKNIDSLGKIMTEFVFCPSKEGLHYMDVSLITPETDYCSCAYIVMFVQKE